ncbi:hypothetical protein C8A03DRAFT_15121 [Achaetomium macrosporum]|uniref:Uncharacterized protein n=1 Tax=Achaetomium macrosporum TaxID=79813 RepID=A0AAN7H793_9PEZI|nr:hypothetical protein C8A03DRAFT_15121 [Achaetomium macrosporum]
MWILTVTFLPVTSYESQHPDQDVQVKVSHPVCAHLTVDGCNCTNLVPHGKRLCTSCEKNYCGYNNDEDQMGLAPVMGEDGCAWGLGC